MKILKRLAICLFFISACNRDETTEPFEEVQIRVLNAAFASFKNCKVSTYDDLYNYGDIGVNEYSAYHTFQKAYRYGYVELTMNNRPYILQPTDFVGETPLSKGKYTYKIIYSEESKNIDIQLIKD
ncbi:hypothetical protein [Foetidibacter luteolus]|uniref:hypothetical protein n=1 Tax=Foetidibacter luteolus TaxID=2608880 RepID=UPI00129AB1FA|nr:hypothetical protein [Foetidibacter luteolus]